MIRAILALLLLASALGFSGCASTDEELSARPWNSPKTWETGIPTSITEGR